jgi:hypothetical protein
VTTTATPSPVVLDAQQFSVLSVGIGLVLLLLAALLAAQLRSR